MQKDLTQKVKQFKQNFDSMVAIMGLLCSDSAFETIYKFKLKEYLDDRDACADKYRETAGYIDTVAFNAGIAQTTGGGLGLFGGLCIVGGLLAAPFTAGTSLALTVAGVAAGVSSAAVTITTSFIKDAKFNGYKTEIKKLTEEMLKKDEIIQNLIKVMKENITKMRELQQESEVQEFLTALKLGKDILYNTGYNVFYKSYQIYTDVKAIRFVQQIVLLIEEDFQVTKGLAMGIAAPGFSVLGRVFIASSTSTAKLLAGALGIFGILFSGWDIYSGVSDILGSKEAAQIKVASFRFDAITREIDDFVNRFRKSGGSEPFDRKHKCILIAKHSGKVFDFLESGEKEVIHQFKLHGKSNQQVWMTAGKTVRLWEANSGKYATAYPNEEQIYQREFNKDEKGQIFQLLPISENNLGEYFIQTAYDKRVLDVRGSSHDDCAEIIQWQKHGGINQQWELHRI